MSTSEHHNDARDVRAARRANRFEADSQSATTTQSGPLDQSEAETHVPVQRPTRSAKFYCDRDEPYPEGSAACFKEKLPFLKDDGDVDEFIGDFTNTIRGRKLFSVMMGKADPLKKEDGTYLDANTSEERTIINRIFEKDLTAFWLFKKVISDNHKRHLKGIDPEYDPTSGRLYSREAWKRFQEAFNRKDPETATRNMKTLVNLKKDQKETVSEHIARRVRIQNKIIDAKVSLDLIFLLLTVDAFGHEDQFAHTRRTILEQSMEDLEAGGLASIKSKLELAESRSPPSAEESSTYLTNTTKKSQCINGCGGHHRYWKCPKPLKPELERKKAQYQDKMRRKRQTKQQDVGAEPNFAAIEAQIASLQALANSKKNNSATRVTFSCIQPAKPSLFSKRLLPFFAMICLFMITFSCIQPAKPSLFSKRLLPFFSMICLFLITYLFSEQPYFGSAPAA